MLTDLRAGTFICLALEFSCLCLCFGECSRRRGLLVGSRPSHRYQPGILLPLLEDLQRLDSSESICETKTLFPIHGWGENIVAVHKWAGIRDSI